MSDPIFSIVKDEEQDLKSKIPSFLTKEQKVTTPTAFLKDYEATGDPVFKKAAGRSLEFLRKMAGGAVIVGAMATPKGRQLVGDEIVEKVAPKLLKGASEAIEKIVKTVELPSGKKLTGIVKRLNLDEIKPSQTGEDLFNETSQGYADGLVVVNRNTPQEKMVRLGKLTDPGTMPPIVVDSNGKIIDGNHRWAAAKLAGLNQIDVIQKDSAGKGQVGGILGAAGVTGATAGLTSILSKPSAPVEYKKPESILQSKKNETVQGSVNHDKLTEDILYRENRGATSTGENLYEVIGVTGDLGKYQVKPETLKDWARPWLGRDYTILEFIHSPEAQEAFYKEFLNVVDAYDLTHDEALAAWHGGWGTIGTGQGTKEERKIKFKAELQKRLKDPEMQRYVKGE